MAENQSDFPNVKDDLAQLAPYLEGDYLAQLGLELLPAERIIGLLSASKYDKDYGIQYGGDAWHSPRDISYGKERSDHDRLAIHALKLQGKDPSVILDKEGRVIDYIAYLQNSKDDRLSALAHELRHVGDEYLARQMHVDDSPSPASGLGSNDPTSFAKTLGEDYIRLVDIYHRENRGVGSPPRGDLGKKIEAEALRKGIAARYKGDPFSDVRYLINRRLPVGRVMRHPVQDVAKRELERIRLKKAERGAGEEVLRSADVGTQKESSASVTPSAIQS